MSLNLDGGLPNEENPKKKFILCTNCLFGKLQKEKLQKEKLKF